MRHERSVELAFFSRSCMSIEPSLLALITIMSIPAILALAKLVPCADPGIRQVLREFPLNSCHFLMQRSPAYSPLEPLLGWSEIPSIPVILMSQLERSSKTFWYPWNWSAGTKGWRFANLVQVMGVMAASALSFIVQDPRGIIPSIIE